MKKLLSLIINQHLVVARYLLVIAVILLITTLFPRHNFNYDYELGKPWKYEDLLAPISFTIKKSEDSLKHEEKLMTAAIKPYYRYDQQTYEAVVAKGQSDLSRQILLLNRDSATMVTSLDSTGYMKLATMLLDTIYQRGILKLAEEHKYSHAPNIDSLNLLVGTNQVYSKEVKQFHFNSSFTCKYIQDYFNNNYPDSTRSTVRFIAQTLCENLRPNVFYDEEKTDEIRKSELDKISPTIGAVEEGEVIIIKGQIVRRDDSNTFDKLNTLKELLSQRQTSQQGQHFIDQYKTDIGYLLITSIILFIFSHFLRIYTRGKINRLREIAFIFLCILSFLYLVSVIVKLQQVSMKFLSLYVLPFCIVPILIRSFFGSMVALYVHIVIVLCSYFIIPLSFEFIMVHFLAGLVAIITNEKTYYWSDFFKSVGYIFITYCIGYLAISLLQETTWEKIRWNTFGWLVVNALLTLLAFQLVPVFEKFFGFLSSITLMELSDLNRELLKKLSRKAPGTFWHSLQVANLAEAAAYEIGANAQLVKVGALYHDIGKMLQPAYFIENQKTAINPHDDLPYEESAKIIINHVTNGIAMAKKANLPNPLIDFIRTHHGDTRTEYFYRKYCQQNPGKEVDDKIFRYPGPRPYSKETAILMMADTIEAASRSLKNPTEEDIDKLVENLVDSKIKHNQFVNCDISFKDITAIKKVFKRQLRSIYHVRISYPSAAKN